MTPTADVIQTLVIAACTALLDAEHCAVWCTEGERVILIDVLVTPSELRFLLGRQHRTIDALRLLCASAAARAGRHVFIEIGEA
jgi:predicted RNA-binding protein YlqC (UPF0109 family)